MEKQQKYCELSKKMVDAEKWWYNIDQHWYKEALRKQQYEEEEAARIEQAIKEEASRIAYASEQAAKLQAYLKKETPEEYKARKESQAERKVKKETHEEYAARTEYLRKKEQLQLEAETQRMLIKVEKQRQDYADYLQRQAERDKRFALRVQEYEANEAYKNSTEGRAEQAEREQRREAKAEEIRNWNTHEAYEKREKKRIEQEKNRNAYEAREKRRELIKTYGGGGGFGYSSGKEVRSRGDGNVEGN